MHRRRPEVRRRGHQATRGASGRGRDGQRDACGRGVAPRAARGVPPGAAAGGGARCAAVRAHSTGHADDRRRPNTVGARPPGAERAGAGARGDPSGVGRAARCSHPRPVAQLRRADLGGAGGPVGGRAPGRTAAAVDRVHAASQRLAGRRGHRPGRDLRGPAVVRGGGASAARRLAVGGGSTGLGPVPGPSGPFHRRPRVASGSRRTRPTRCAPCWSGWRPTRRSG